MVKVSSTMHACMTSYLRIHSRSLVAVHGLTSYSESLQSVQSTKSQENSYCSLTCVAPQIMVITFTLSTMHILSHSHAHTTICYTPSKNNSVLFYNSEK